MYDRRGISESTVWVHNPLPPITDAEVLAKAGLDDTAEAATLSPLHMDWQYGGGFSAESIRLQPGERTALRRSDADVMLKELQEKGLVSYPLDADAETIARVCQQGVKAAVTFFADRGNKRLTAIRKIHNLDRQAMEDNRHEHWSFYYNQALSDLLKAHLTPKPAPKSAKTKAA